MLVLSGCKEDARASKFMSVQNSLNSIPEKDREILTSFFRFLFSDDALTYTLYGKKPMSLVDYIPNETVWSLYQPGPSLILEKGEDVWRKYSTKFPSEEFVLKFIQDNEGQRAILLISKTNMLNAIVKNLEIFQEYLGEQMNPKRLVNQICYVEEAYMEPIKDHTALLGILLGFGNVNSQYFERRYIICEEINSKMTPPFSPVQDLKTLQPLSKILVKGNRGKSFSKAPQLFAPSEGYANLGDELNEINLHQEGFEVYGSDYWLDKQLSPVFAMDREDPETKALQEEYLATGKKITQAYREGDFLEVTLNQWMNPL